MNNRLTEMLHDEQFNRDLLVNMGVVVGAAVLVSGAITVLKWYAGYKVAVAAGVIITPKVWLAITIASAQVFGVGVAVGKAVSAYNQRQPRRVPSRPFAAA